MARTMNMSSLEQKIEKAEQEVSRAKKSYDRATAELKKLLDKREELRNRELMKVIADSSLSYNEIVSLIQNADKHQEKKSED